MAHLKGKRLKSRLLLMVVLLGQTYVCYSQQIYVCPNVYLNLDTLSINNTVNFNKEGFWITQFHNGNIKSIVKYKNGTKSGVFMKFNKTGEIKLKGCYLDSEKYGFFTFYSKYGKKKKIIKYLRGQAISVNKPNYPIFPPDLVLKEKCPCSLSSN